MDGIHRALARLEHRLEQLHADFHRLERKVDLLMATVKQDFEALRQAIDDATNQVAARIDRLSQGIRNSMSDQEVAELKAGFKAEVDRLTLLGQDPQNPVP